MMNSGAKPRLVFFGNERLATGVETNNPTLQMLLDEGYEIAAIVLHHTFSNSRKSRELEILSVATRHDIPILYVNTFSDTNALLRTYDAAAGVLVAFGKIVPESTIELFPRGIVNLHPSALPKHRGPTPIESIILDGSRQTAVSVMALTGKMDAGPVYAQSPINLTGNETKQELASKLGSLGAELLRSTLPSILSGELTPKPQEESAATYDQLIRKDAGRLDITKSSEQLVREVRAFAGWPAMHSQLAGKDIIITEAHADIAISPEPITGFYAKDGKLCINTSSSVLVIDRVKPAGKPDMPASAFLAGYGRLLKPSNSDN